MFVILFFIAVQQAFASFYCRKCLRFYYGNDLFVTDESIIVPFDTTNIQRYLIYEQCFYQDQGPVSSGETLPRMGTQASAMSCGVSEKVFINENKIHSDQVFNSHICGFAHPDMNVVKDMVEIWLFYACNMMAENVLDLDQNDEYYGQILSGVSIDAICSPWGDFQGGGDTACANTCGLFTKCPGDEATCSCKTDQQSGICTARNMCEDEFENHIRHSGNPFPQFGEKRFTAEQRKYFVAEQQAFRDTFSTTGDIFWFSISEYPGMVQTASPVPPPPAPNASPTPPLPTPSPTPRPTRNRGCLQDPTNPACDETVIDPDEGRDDYYDDDNIDRDDIDDLTGGLPIPSCGEDCSQRRTLLSSIEEIFDSEVFSNIIMYVGISFGVIVFIIIARLSVSNYLGQKPDQMKVLQENADELQDIIRREQLDDSN